MASLCSLPLELYAEIFVHLEREDLNRLSMTSSKMAILVRGFRKYHERFLVFDRARPDRSKFHLLRRLDVVPNSGGASLEEYARETSWVNLDLRFTQRQSYYELLVFPEIPVIVASTSNDRKERKAIETKVGLMNQILEFDIPYAGPIDCLYSCPTLVENGLMDHLYHITASSDVSVIASKQACNHVGIHKN